MVNKRVDHIWGGAAVQANWDDRGIWLATEEDGVKDWWMLEAIETKNWRNGRDWLDEVRGPSSDIEALVWMWRYHESEWVDLGWEFIILPNIAQFQKALW